ncbi:MAG TPA: tRNA pseudouridine(13) synthase TruD [Gemmataceae bacterium]|jgi:tRNA pseudouridine13 synthase|nr:tRNA pseudouridine(13) synthase TruD [Gemmataceae bacterium]
MKLKQRPEDFRVEEFTPVIATPTGPFAFYKLEKRGWTTPDALAAIRRRWKIDLKRMSSGGLKDRHAHTIQYLTIHNGPENDLTHEGFTVTYLGRVAERFTSQHIRANSFTLTMRSMGPADVERAEHALAEVATVGIPNYFDDQRFGSVSDGKSFVAREMVLGNFEGALKHALAAPYEHDRADAKREKAILNSRWGDWPTCKAELPRSHARSIVDYLVHHPIDFKGACERLRPELGGLYLSAWQSHLWNRMLDRWLRDHVPADQLVAIRLKTAEVVMPRSMPVESRLTWDDLSLPLPSARLKLDPAAPWARVVTAVMADEGIPLDQMKIKGMQHPFFSKGERIAKVPVGNVSWQADADEINRGRRKLLLRFELPRGCYATMLVKRIMVPA